MSRMAQRARRLAARFTGAEERSRLRSALGALQARAARAAASITEAEFRCYSQFGEDGIIQWLIGRVPIVEESFVEIGVEDYREANTRFLLEHDDWQGLIIDSGTAHVGYLAGSDLRWRHTIDARSAFVTRENVNELLAPMGRDLGLLSIDVDGIDYWLWEAITGVEPRIVVVEYNSVFGADHPVTVPYDAAFDRTRAHSSTLYFGASLAALEHLGRSKGYRLVGSNSAGNNAFFVRDDVAGDLPPQTAAEARRESRFRESRDDRGGLTYISDHAARRALIADRPLVDVVSGEELTVGDLTPPSTSRSP